MSSIPLPALQVRPPESSPDLVGNYGRILQLRDLLQNAPLQHQALQQQVQAGQLENQQRQIQLQDQQTLRTIAPDFLTKDSNGNVTGYDYNGFFRKAASSGVSPNTLIPLQKSITENATASANLTKAQFENQQNLLNQAFQHIEGIRGTTDPNQRQQLWNSATQWAQQNGIQAQLPQQAPDDAGLGTIEAGLGMHAQQLADAKTQAETAKAAGQGAQAQAEVKKINAQTDPTSPLYSPSPAAVAMGTAPGAAQIQAGEVRQAGAKASAEAAARQPYELSLARARQAIQDGDPRSAAQLLINGDVAPSQIISSRKPEFAQQAFQAAHDLSGGTWNAQSAEANFKVAGSPANIGFFGSAKSLTDKGGTLDQLAAAAKDIPQGQIPALNSLADWTQAAAGSGPIAKYASLALGVSDDYAKVMNNGTGSDSSRAQALNLVKPNQSPAQRAGSIEGIRGAVNSQMTSRIGDNPVLKRMYGGSDATGGSQPPTRPAGVPANAVWNPQGNNGRGSWRIQ